MELLSLFIIVTGLINFKNVVLEILYVYKALDKEFTKTYNAEDVIINYSLMNFNFLITIFILNLFYISITQSNYQKERVMNLSLQDYTLLIINY